MHMSATFDDPTTGSASHENDWFAYDSMDRVIVTDGGLSGSAGVSGTYVTVSGLMSGSGFTSGSSIGYNLAGERISATSYMSKSAVFELNLGGVLHPETFSWTDTHIETYSYTPDGYLSATSVSDGYFTPVSFGSGFGAGSYTQLAAEVAAVDTRDALGRVTGYVEYEGPTTIFSETTTYNADNLVTLQVSDTATSAGNTEVTSTTNDYDLFVSGSGYTGAYEGGQVTFTETTGHTLSAGGGSVGLPDKLEFTLRPAARSAAPR